MQNGKSNLLEHPETQQPSYKMEGIPQTSDLSFSSNNNYWISKKENRIVLKNILDFLSAPPIKGSCKIQMDENQHVHIFVLHDQFQEHIYFPEGDSPSGQSFFRHKENTLLHRMLVSLSSSRSSLSI